MTKKKAKLKLIDVFIFAFCFAIGTSSIWLFYKDLNNSTSRKDKEKIGVITFKDKIGQRKFDDRIVWERIQTGTQLYNYDTLRTADLASATITFTDGTVININENTMLQVYKSKDGMGISVGDGNITVDTTNANSSVDLTMKNGSKLVLESGSRLTAKSDSSSENNSFNLQSGKASIVNSEGVEQQAVKEGEALKINSEGQIKKESISVNSVSENLHVLSFSGEEKKVLLEWNVIEELKDSLVRVEVSTDKDFSEIKQSFTTTGASSVELAGEPGTKLYWRIYPLDDKNNIFTGLVLIDSIEPIKQISPTYDSIIRHGTDFPQIHFSWTENRFATHYKFELCDEVNFENPLISNETTETYMNVSLKKDGTYYWRVTPYYSINETGYANPTELSLFSLKKAEIAEKPLPLLPRENAIIELGEESKNVTFLWKDDSVDAAYKLVVAADKNFTQPIFESESTENKIKQKLDTTILEPENIYYWKVLRKNKAASNSGLPDAPDGIASETNPAAGVTDGNSSDITADISASFSAESEARAFVVQEFIAGKNNTIFPPEGYCTELSKLPSLNFIWKLAKSYQESGALSVLQISDKIDFSSNLREIKTADNTYGGISLEKGEFFWRVGVIPEDYNEPIAFTNPQSLKVIGELGTPELVLPEKNSVLPLYGDNAVKVEWNEVEGADFYKLRLYNAQTESTIAEIQSVKDSKATVFIPKEISASLKGTEKIPLKFTVQAVSEQTDLTPLRIGKTGEQSFYVRAIIPVALETPQENAKISGLSALRQKTEFSWKIGDKPEKMQFILQKQNSAGVMKTVQSFETSRQLATLSRLTPGFYQWTVKASTKEGISLDSTAWNTFTILPPPELAKPVITLPAKNAKFKTSYFKTKRNIAFEWQKVEGATDYEFAIYQKNADGRLRQIIRKKDLSKTEYKFKDLALLDNGTFECHIKAFAHAKDGFEEQYSPASVGQFTIEIELPKDIKTKDSGIMYGN